MWPVRGKSTTKRLYDGGQRMIDTVFDIVRQTRLSDVFSSKDFPCLQVPYFLIMVLNQD